VWHEEYLWHDSSGSAGPLGRGEPDVEPGDFGDAPDARRRLHSLLAVSGLLEHLKLLTPRRAQTQELLRFHTREYLELIERLSKEGGGSAGPNAHFGARGYDIARLAVGGAITAVDAVLDDAVDNAYALIRPAGHHAMSDSGYGSCLFANAALAALHAKEARGVERAAILDWDVHFGNGTQTAFWTDPSVLTVSIHQADWSPRREGNIDDVGAGPGRGANINAPLPPGTGSGGYLALMKRVIVPAIRSHEPHLIFVCCGLDANAMDPFGRMMLTSETFRAMTRQMLNLAAETCRGRLVFVHEGGYAPVYVPFCGLAVIEELSGGRTTVEDPFLARYAHPAYDELQPGQEAIIRVLEGRLGKPSSLK
jgi:acetoin utilization deacetylase AcuC-like enzyme